MDTTELIALGIVAIAAILLAVLFFRKKNGGGCGADCLKTKKKDEGNS